MRQRRRCEPLSSARRPQDWRARRVLAPRDSIPVGGQRSALTRAGWLVFVVVLLASACSGGGDQGAEVQPEPSVREPEAAAPAEGESGSAPGGVAGPTATSAPRSDAESSASAGRGVYTAVAAGWGHSCAIRGDGAVTCWGDNNWGQAEPPGGVYVAITAGRWHSCALDTGGAVTCWGSNDERGAQPPRGGRRGLTGQADAPGGVYSAVAAGGEHSCAVRADGAVIVLGRQLFWAGRGAWGCVFRCRCRRGAFVCAWCRWCRHVLG